MLAVTVTQTGAKELRAKLNALGKATLPRATIVMRKATVLMERELKTALTGTKRRDPFLGTIGPKPPLLGTRTGHTRRSVTSEVVKLFNQIVGVVGSPVKTLLAHEEGAYMRGNQYLRIPLAKAQTAAGVDRNAGRSIRGLPGTFILRSKAGNLFVVRRRGRFDLEFLYLLKHSVRLPARHTFRHVAHKVQPRVEALFDADMALLIRKAN